MSELVEKVAREIRVATLKTVVSEITDAEIDEIFRTRLVDYDPEARAAIAAVAEWLDPKQMPSLLANTPAEIISARLRNELEQPKGAAGDGR